MNQTDPLFVPPAAEGLPLPALDSAAAGASALDAWARTPYGRNLLAHALVQLARDGWLRTEPGAGFEPVRDRETPEPETASAVFREPPSRAAVLLEAADVAESLRRFERVTAARWSAQVSENVGILRVADELRRLAAEAQQQEPEAPTDQGALRDRIAEALMRWAEDNNAPKYAALRRPETVRQNAYGRADAVLAVLSESSDQAAKVQQPAACGRRRRSPAQAPAPAYSRPVTAVTGTRTSGPTSGPPSSSPRPPTTRRPTVADCARVDCTDYDPCPACLTEAHTAGLLPAGEASTVGPRCGNNPNFRLSPSDQKVVDEFKAYLKRRAAGGPPERDPFGDAADPEPV